MQAQVSGMKGHAALLFYSLGNEWNYNGLYAGKSHAESISIIDRGSKAIKAADPSRPIVTVYGEVRQSHITASPPLATSQSHITAEAQVYGFHNGANNRD